MDRLPLHLVNEILFRLDLKSLAMMQCTGRSLRSNISDPYFYTEYLHRVGSGLFHISPFGSTSLFSYPFGETRSPTLLRNNVPLEMDARILGSCSGLVLLFIKGLCIANPVTKRFRFLDHSKSNLVPVIVKRLNCQLNERNRVGLAVDQIDETTQRFKIVCITEDSNPDEKIYRFEINAGDSLWRFSQSTVTCCSSDLAKSMKPVYFHGALHWLRNDGSIISFNSETERSRLIQIKFDVRKQGSKITLFTVSDNKLTLITATEEVIYVYTLENILKDPKWVLVRQIRNRVADNKKELIYWKVVAYDEKRLVLYEREEENDGVVRGFDLRAKEWRVMGTIPVELYVAQEFYQFKPSLSSVIHLDDDEKEACKNDKRFSSLSMIMRMIGGNISPPTLKSLLGKRLIEEKNRKQIEDGRAEKSSTKE